jgi:hypothetical protein
MVLLEPAEEQNMTIVVKDEHLKLLNRVRTVHMDEGNVEYEEIMLGLFNELEAPSVMSTVLVEQIAQALFWVKRHSLDKEGFLLNQLKSELKDLVRYGENRDLNDRLDGALRSGRYSDEYLQFEQDLFSATSVTLDQLRGRLNKPALEKLKIFDELIHRQLQNLRHLQKSLDAVDFKKRLVKKLDLEIAQMEKDALAIEAD